MTKNALGQKYIGFFGLKPGNVIKLKNFTSFHIVPDTISLGRSFPAGTLFTILEMTEPKMAHDGKERIITVLFENQRWHKRITRTIFPLMFEVIL